MTGAGVDSGVGSLGIAGCRLLVLLLAGAQVTQLHLGASNDSSVGGATCLKESALCGGPILLSDVAQAEIDLNFPRTNRLGIEAEERVESPTRFGVLALLPEALSGEEGAILDRGRLPGATLRCDTTPSGGADGDCQVS